MVKLWVGPTHFLVPISKYGVTVYVATSCAVPVFTPLKDAIVPLPEAPPTVVLVFVHS